MPDVKKPAPQPKQPRTPMPEQDAKARARNFDEVALGYTEELALKEVQRCLACRKPGCREGCPVAVDIPGFVSLVKEGRYVEAAWKIKETNALPAVCGRVCPQEKQCESKCVIGKRFEPLAIGRLERFVADYEREHPDEAAKLAKSRKESTPKKDKVAAAKKVAVIGSGPGGLTCASDLARLGYTVTVFEALHEPGGVLVYGIPEFRLPKSIVGTEVDYIKSLGVEVRTDAVIGNLFSIEELREDQGFDAVFIASGAGFPMFMGIPGENLNGVYSANEFLTRANLMKAYLFPEYDTPINCGRNVAVVGGGNVAMDSARVAMRLGAENVYLVYRRSMEELPARAEEVHHAEEEGIDFRLLNNPVAIIGDENGAVKAMECIQMELGEPDASGRRRPVEKPGSEFTLDVDTVIMAIGTRANPLIGNSTEGLDLTDRGYIIADEETGATSLSGVFAGGDIVTGSATVIAAMGAGKKAAAAIHEYLLSK